MPIFDRHSRFSLALAEIKNASCLLATAKRNFWGFSSFSLNFPSLLSSKVFGFSPITITNAILIFCLWGKHLSLDIIASSGETRAENRNFLFNVFLRQKISNRKH